MLSVEKSFPPVPFAHRAHTHDGHCRFIHGHDWTFSVSFVAHTLDRNGFVYDFGKMGKIKSLLALFDHALVISENDPAREEILTLKSKGLANVVVVKSCTCEGLAAWFGDCIGEILLNETQGRVSLHRITLKEGQYNSASIAYGKPSN